MLDSTENIRRKMVSEINSNPYERELLEQKYGKDNVWDTSEFIIVFKVDVFEAPFCFVTNRNTREQGTVMFQDYPRFYYKFEPVYHGLEI